ncbi:MAG: hypothetical protein AUG51_04835 [Acidobacteria bacterium 13_1_20CM_3_53_8]|nr:MAG: hypothetical protein AUG51_04835 [Acidobacteria bacterium 13_1_20CM_3_53_8]
MWRRFLSLVLLAVLTAASGVNAQGAVKKASSILAEATWAFDTHEDRNGYPRTNVFLVVGGRRVLVRRNVIAQFTVVAPEDYRSHSVPATAIAACQGWWAGGGEDLYVIRRNQQLIVFIRYIDEGIEPGRFRRLKVISSSR